MKTIKSSRMAPLPMPIEVQLQPTNRCNANCHFCWFHDSKQDFVEPPDEVWLGLTDEICARDIPKATICGGGEPLLRAQLVLQMMEKFSKAGIDGALITNGMLITEQFAKRVVELQWRSVQVSIHAPTAQLNDSLMGREGAFNLALRGIKNMNRYKRLLKSALPELAMRIVLTPSNFSALPEFVRFTHSQGVSKVFVRLDNRTGMDPQSESAPSEKDRLFLKGVLERASKVAEELEQCIELEFDTHQLFLQEAAHSGARISQDEPQEKTPESADGGVLNSHCPIPFGELVIFANGSASPCCNFFGMQFKSEEQRAGWLEDLTHKSLKQVWQGGFAALRSTSKEGLSQICMSCSMDMKHWKGQGPEIFFHQKFEHYRKQKRYREGIRYGLEQLKEYSDNPTLYCYIGEFYMELEEYNAAIGVMERLERLGGDVEDLHFLLGRCHFEIGEYKQALKRFEENLLNITIPESHPRTWHYMTLCHLKLRHYDKMKHCLDKAKEFVNILGKGEHPGEKQLREFVGQWPAPFFHEEFKQLKEHKKYRDGIVFGQQQLKEYRDSAVLHHYIGEFHMELEEYDKAVEHLSKAVQLDKKMEWTRFSLGKCYFQTRMYEEAEKALKANLELTSNRLSHFHSWLFLAMAADARNDKRGCGKALQSLKDFKEFIGEEIPLEREFLRKLGKEKRLWLKRAKKTTTENMR